MTGLSLPDPVDLGFSPKFRSWRPDQVTAIDRTLVLPQRFIGACAPTGFGKSLYGVATALLGGYKRAVYLTSSLGLQDQLGDDFRANGLVDIRGQRNYPCLAVDTGAALHSYRRHRGYVGCEEGPCHSGVKCDLAPDRSTPYVRPACRYYGAVHDARRAGLVSTNYAYWLSSNAFGQGLGEIDLLILDEAHDADKELEKFLTFEISLDDAKFISARLPESERIEDWVIWATHHARMTGERLSQWQVQHPRNTEEAREVRTLKRIAGLLDRLKDLTPEDWVLEMGNSRFKASGVRQAKFSPLRVARYAEQFLFCGVKKVLLMSATMTRKTMGLLGITADQSSLLEFRSTFPAERRPVVCVETSPSVQLSMRMDESLKTVWMRRIDRLIAARLDRCGIIHAVSYARAKDIFQNSDHRDIMLMHDSSNTLAVVAEYKRRAKSGQPCILLSPSIMTGYDFPHEECRYQIIAKVPLPDMRGVINEWRREHDPELAFYLAAQGLQQACGRGMRAEDDWCETLIVDDTFGNWFFDRSKKHMAKWFLEAVWAVEELPEPINF